MLLAAAAVVTPARVLAPGWLLVDGERIVDVEEGPPPRSPDLDLGAATVVPGFVDLHVHGGGGASFDTGTAEAAQTVLATHLVRGTTTMAASLVTDSPDRTGRAARELALLVRDGRLAGVHLEGQWLSPRRAGAHRRDLLTAPDVASTDALLAAGGGTVRMVTMAPELPGGLDAVRRSRWTRRSATPYASPACPCSRWRTPPARRPRTRGAWTTSARSRPAAAPTSWSSTRTSRSGA
jgi:N-acetylglucosamine-6-phosphate deacetylase